MAGKVNPIRKKRKGTAPKPKAPHPKPGVFWPMDRDSSWFYEHDRPTHPVIKKKTKKKTGTKHRGKGLPTKRRYA